MLLRNYASDCELIFFETLMGQKKANGVWESIRNETEYSLNKYFLFFSCLPLLFFLSEFKSFFSF